MLVLHITTCGINDAVRGPTNIGEFEVSQLAHCIKVKVKVHTLDICSVTVNNFRLRYWYQRADEMHGNPPPR